jgi:xylulokinase
MSIMGIDIGTTGTKAIAFSEDGKILAQAYNEYDLVFPRPNWVEFDVNVMWEKVFDVIKRVNNNDIVKKDPVSVLSVSTIAESFTPINKKGEPIYNTIYSTDARSLRELEYIYTKISREKLYDVTGYPPGFIAPLNKILWIKNNLPEIYAKTNKILFTDDLLYHNLGIKETKINYSLCSRTMFFDIRQKKWSKSILDDSGIDINLFSEPSPSGVEIGHVSDEVARELGFTRKVSVVTGGHDQPCAALGVGALGGGITADGMGTVECETIAVDDLIINKDMLKSNFSIQIHAVPDSYVSLAYNLTSGSILKWYRDKICTDDKKIAESKKVHFNDYFFSMLNFEPSNLYVLPYFSSSGTPYFDSLAKGTITGLSLSSTKQDIFKAIIEGLVFEIAMNVELLGKAGVKINEFRSVGGNSIADYWLQLKSSIIGKPIKRMEIKEAGCLATMMLAGSGVGLFTIQEAVSNFVKSGKEFYPDDSVRERYQENFAKYKKIYGALKEIF